MDILSSYDGSNATYRLLRAYNWGPVQLNLGFFKYRGLLSFLNCFRDMSLAQRELTLRSIGLLGVGDQQHVLDIACGRGTSSFLVQQLFPTAQVVGIDLLPENVRVAQTLFAKQGSLRYQEGDACRLDFPDASFDRVLCIEAAFHFPDRAEFLRQCRRVLRPGGKLVVVDIVWNTDGHRAEPTYPPFQMVREIWQYEDLYSLDEYRRHARQAGFEVAAEHDWTRNVNDPLLMMFGLLSWLGRRPWGRNLLRWHNGLVGSLSDSDWEHVIASADAHREMRHRSRYAAFEFVAAGQPRESA